MAYMKVFEDYKEKLVKVLPMKDVIFTTQLSSNKILPDNVDAHIKSSPLLATEPDKADYYLKNVIKKSLDIGGTEELNILITVMEKCGYRHVEKLAKGMKSDLDKELKDELSPKTGDKRKRSTSESDANPSTKPRRERSNADEKVFSNNDGRGYVDERVREEKKKAVCLVYPPNGAGTGFIGKIDLDEEDSIVLVTNYHVIIDGLPDWYEDAKEITENMKIEILRNARRSDIIVEGKKIKLSGGILVESSCKMSSAKSLDYFIIKLDEAKLEKELPTINLNCPAVVNDNDLISIFQHPREGPISSSSSNCGIVGSHKGDNARLMVYRCGTDPGSSGGPILKVVKKDLVIVGLHRGGLEDNWDKQDAIGYNYGTPFSDIITSMQKNWHPTVPDHKNENDKKDIYHVVNNLVKM